MRSIEVFQFLQRKVLVTRESASMIREAINSSVEADGEVNLDFTGIDAMTPSFVDEVLGIIDDAKVASNRHELRVVFLHTPTPLSTKYLAIGKRHGARMSESGSVWEITGANAKAIPQRFLALQSLKGSLASRHPLRAAWMRLRASAAKASRRAAVSWRRRSARDPGPRALP